MSIAGVIKAGSTEVITRVFLYKDAGATAGTEGDPITGLDNTSSGLKIVSLRDDEGTAEVYAAGTDIQTITTIGTHADPSASNVRFKEIDATNMPGWYEIQWLDARWASGAAEHIVTIHGATDLATCNFYYVLDALTTSDIDSTLSSYGVPTTTNLNARTLPSADYATDTALDSVATDIAEIQNGTSGVNVTMISGDTTAANNLESAFDGTGYDVGGIDVSELNAIVDDLLNGGRLDLLIDAIKAKTDDLTFTVANQVDANVGSINEVTVVGTGTSGDKWRA